jgi:hypothetical protein
MESRRRVEFTGVKLAGGAALAAPVEKAAGPQALEGRSGREARWRGRKTGCCALGGGDAGWQSRGAVAEAARRCGDVSFLGQFGRDKRCLLGWRGWPTI